MRFTIAAILFAATASTSLAQTGTAGGGVKRTSEGVCMEPGHPSYDTALTASSHPTMRDCVLSGGRRDTLPNDATANPTTDPQGNGEGTQENVVDTTEPASTPQTTTPNPVAPNTQGVQPSVPNLPDPYEAAPTDGATTAPGRPKAQPGAPKGITLPAQPSYSEEPGLFRPPASYFGRGPKDFEP